MEGGGDEDDEKQNLMDNIKPTITDPDSDADKDVKSVKAIDYYERMLKVKWGFKTKVRACTFIARIFRGHRARLRVADTKQSRNQKRQMAYYS